MPLLSTLCRSQSVSGGGPMSPSTLPQVQGGILSLLGVMITGRIPVLIASNKHNAGYLAAKAERMGHEMLRGEDQK